MIKLKVNLLYSLNSSFIVAMVILPKKKKKKKLKKHTEAKQLMDQWGNQSGD